MAISNEQYQLAELKYKHSKTLLSYNHYRAALTELERTVELLIEAEDAKGKLLLVRSLLDLADTLWAKTTNYTSDTAILVIINYYKRAEKLLAEMLALIPENITMKRENIHRIINRLMFLCLGGLTLIHSYFAYKPKMAKTTILYGQRAIKLFADSNLINDLTLQPWRYHIAMSVAWESLSRFQNKKEAHQESINHIKSALKLRPAFKFNQMFEPKLSHMKVNYDEAKKQNTLPPSVNYVDSFFAKKNRPGLANDVLHRINQTLSWHNEPISDEKDNPLNTISQK